MKYYPTWNKIYTFNYLKKGFYFLTLQISKVFFIPPFLRPKILSICGIQFSNPKTVFIGSDVLFDNLLNTKTFIGKNVVITSGVKIINHYPILNRNGVSEYKLGDVIIEDNVFIGMNALIIKPVKIGKGAVIGAGAVITEDVPEYAIVVGNPASIISFVK